MDLSLLCTDDQTRPPPALTGGQTGDLNSFPLLHSPTENTLSAYQAGAEAVSDLSDPADESTETLSNISPSQEKSTDSSGCLKPLSSSYNMSECLALCPEPAPKDEFRVCSYFGPSEPVLPLLPALSFSLIQQNSTPQPFQAMSSTSEVLMEPSVTEPLSSYSFSSDHPQTTYLLRSLSHQSDSLESDTAIAPVSDLYIFESETQDFILNPNVDPEEIKCPEYWPLSQTRVENADPDCNTHVLVCDSENVVTQCHHGPGEEQAMLDYESDVSRHTRPPAVDVCEAGLVSVNDARQRKAEVTDLTSQPRRSDSPIELWLDACQYLASEDTEDRSVLDKTGYSVTQGGLTTTSDLSFSPGETQESSYNPDGSEEIGWPGDDTIGWGPPVERWSSVDSWATALSDWTGFITAPPEDFTAAFTEIGAEIDALTQALAEVNAHTDTETSKEREGQGPAVLAQSQPPMGVQDQPLKAQNMPKSSVLAGQSCLSSVESLCDSPSSAQGGCLATQSSQAEHSPRLTYQRSSMGSSGATVVSLDVIPGSTSSAGLDRSLFGGFVESFGTDIFIRSEEDPIILNIIEDTDLEEQNASAGLITKKPLADGLREVTNEYSISQLGTPADSNVHINVHAHVSAEPLPDFDGACQLEPQRGSPKFIMPIASLGIDSSHICWTSSSLEGDQICDKRSLNDNRNLSSDHVQPCTLWPTSDGITCSESDEEFIHDKENTIESSEKGQLDSDTADRSITARKTTIEEINDLSRELSDLSVVRSDHLFISEKNRVAVITLDLDDPFVSRAAKPIATAVKSEKAELNQERADKMPHKTHKSTSDKTRSKKDKSGGHHYGAQASKKQENLSHHVSAQQVCKQQETHPLTGKNHTSENAPAGLEDKEAKLVTETGVTTEKALSKPHGKKKKKHGQSATGGKSVVEPLAEVENGAKAKTARGRIDMFEAKLGAKSQKDGDQTHGAEKTPQQPEAKASQGEEHKKNTGPLNDDIIKRRRLSEDKFGKFGKIVNALESKLPKPDVSIQAKGEEPKVDAGATRKKAYSEVVKQTAPPKEGDESRVSLNISNASHKDLGKYRCQLTSLHGSVTLEYILTYEVLSEIVIPPSPTTTSSAPLEVECEEEDIHCSRLMFKEDFLSDQYFGENQPASIITQKVHFGEGMHRRAFRTKLNMGQIPLLLPGHPCVLKVHNAISYGTKNNDELIEKNFNLAVEECQVQNTAREYIKAYTVAAQSVETFGEIPEIIPIYLVHRPSNDIPYATLEEELIGDFVKYSVKDGKEINLMRRDSEAGQKCCAFQHWVYHNTDGNLLVTDMQGFKGNCATSFIEQFKALHQCNRYCEILGLKSLQPKAKKPAPKPKPQPQPPAAPKKKTFGPTVKAKS
ncbi:Alpha-protein kinase 2 [Nibea albiflora]|uniref:Alpha-protein kinase 2 n=1 Tax=Nibea albiflora TaxID=240163 RepID=A0ACB7F8H2_NIBAL|nr:Alpha-protein kinase 2 [Nibea albiflora]